MAIDKITPIEKFEIDGVEIPLAGLSGSSKLSQVIDRSITELTAEDFGGTTKIGRSSLAFCTKLKSFTLPETVVEIDIDAFTQCSSLENIIIPDSVQKINGGAFQNVGQNGNLEKIHIGKNVNYIASNAFQTNQNQNYITVDSENITYDSRDNCNCLIETASNTVLAGSSNSTIPMGVVKIGPYAFHRKTGLKNIMFPEGFERFDNNSFAHCTSLESITMPTTLVYNGYYTFNGCTALKSVIFSGQSPAIGSNIFTGCNSIMLYDFSNCTSVPTLSSATSLGHASGCIIRIPASLYDEWTTATNWSALTDVVWEKYPAEEQPTLITFYINNDTSGDSGSTEYRAESGMTLEQWVNSKYNTDGWVLAEDTFNDYYIVKSFDELSSIGELETEDNASLVAIDAIPATTVITNLGTYKRALY